MSRRSINALKQRLNPYSLSLIFLISLLIIGFITYNESRPVYRTVLTRAEPADTSFPYFAVLGTFQTGKNVHLSIHNIQGEMIIYLSQSFIGKDNREILTFQNVTGSFEYSLKVKESGTVLSLHMTSLENKTEIYTINVSITGLSIIYYYIDATLLFFLVASIVLLNIPDKTREKYSKEELIIRLKKTKRYQGRTMVIARQELKKYNYALYSLVVFLSTILNTRVYALYAIVDPEHSEVSVLRQYFNEMIVYETRVNFLVLSIAALGLLHSIVQSELKEQDLHLRSITSLSVFTVFGKSLAMTFVFSLTWILVTGPIVLLELLVSHKFKVYWVFWVFIVTLVGLFFMFSLLFYTLELWVPPKLKYGIPIVIYLLLFRVDFVTTSVGFLLFPLLSFSENILMYVFMFILELSFIVGLCVFSIDKRKRVFLNDMKYYRLLTENFA